MSFEGGRALAVEPWEPGPATLCTSTVPAVLQRNRARRQAFNAVMAEG